MTASRLTRQVSRVAAWRMNGCSIARSTPHLSSTLQIQRHIPTVRHQQITSTSQAAFAAGNNTMEESLRNMDLDAAEKHMKDWFGDHASWSHEQLLNLAYGTTPSKILKQILTDTRGGSHISAELTNIRRLRYWRSSTRGWPTVFPALDARRMGTTECTI
jgi:hypothetical protein